MNPQTTTNLRQRLKAYERSILIEAMEKHPNRPDQAHYLDVPYVTLWRKLTAHGLI